MRWVVVAAALAEAGFMVVDGVRALTVGDYFTPSSGEHAGRLGPWASVVGSIGLDPRSSTMKRIFEYQWPGGFHGPPLHSHPWAAWDVATEA